MLVVHHALSCAGFILRLFLKWFHFFCLKTICFNPAGPLDRGYSVYERHTCRRNRHREALLYTPSSARTVLGTAGTSGISGAGHFRQRCEPSPALRRQHKSTTTHMRTHTCQNAQESVNYFTNVYSEASCQSNCDQHSRTCLSHKCSQKRNSS